MTLTLAISAGHSTATNAMPQPLPRAAVFDLDGTLIDSAPDLHLLLAELLAEQGLGAPSLEAVRDMVGDGTRALVARALAAIGRPAGEETLDRLHGRFLALYEASPCRLTRPYAHAEATLARLADRGTRLGLCTNKPQRITELLLEAVGLRRYFAAIVGGDVLPVRKPDPAHLAEVLRRLGAGPASAVMVGDSRNDLLSARGAGMACILVSFGYSKVPAADLGADAVIDDLARLPEALAGLAGRA